MLLDAIDKGILFDGKEQKVLKEKGAFQTKFISDIEADIDRDSFINIKDVLTELGLESAASPFDYRYFFEQLLVNDMTLFFRVIRYICECVSNRAAALAGAGVASLVNKISKRRITVGMDGSVYKFHPHFGARFEP